MCHKLPVIKKGKGCKGRRASLRILSGLDMDRLKHGVPGLCHLLQYWYILRRKRALVCVILLRLLKIDIFNSHIFQCILAFDAENSRILSLHISVIHA